METASHIAYFTWIKNISYVAAFFAFGEYLGFETEIMGIFVLLMILDIITGVIRAYVVEGGTALRSAIGTRGILAKLLLMAAIFSVALAGKGVGIEAEALANGAMGVFILSEMYSILGNIHSTKTRKPKAEFDAVTWILGQVRILLEKTIK
jgi:toxin secretion/phage lysis holin